MHNHATSLVTIAPGEHVRVRHILFEGLRSYCADVGLHEGDRVTRLEGDPSTVLLRADTGAAVSCPSDFARFVEVARDEVWSAAHGNTGGRPDERGRGSRSSRTT
jgi:FeoA domain